MQQAEVSLTLKIKLLGQKTNVNIFGNKGQMRKLQPNELHLFLHMVLNYPQKMQHQANYIV